MDGSEWEMSAPPGYFGAGHPPYHEGYPGVPVAPFPGGPLFQGPGFVPPVPPMGPPFVPFNGPPRVPKFSKSSMKPKSQPVKCDVCDMVLNSQTVFETHVTGKTHKKNLAIKNGEIPDPKFLVGSSKKKQKPAVVFEAQSQPTRGPVTLDKFYKKCEVCNLFVNSERQWEIHNAGSKHAKAVLLSKTKFKLGVIAADTKAESPNPASPTSSSSDPPPITVKLPRGIVVVDSERQKFVCDYCGNKPLNSMLQIEQHLKSSEHLKRSGARFKPIGHKSKDAERPEEAEGQRRSDDHRRQRHRDASASSSHCGKTDERSNRRRKEHRPEVIERSKEKRDRRDSEDARRQVVDRNLEANSTDDKRRKESHRRRSESSSSRQQELKRDRSPLPSSRDAFKTIRRRTSEERHLQRDRDVKRKLSSELFDDRLISEHRSEKAKDFGDTKHQHLCGSDKRSRHRHVPKDSDNLEPFVANDKRRPSSYSDERGRSRSRDMFNGDVLESRLVTYHSDEREMSPVSDGQGDRWSDEERFYSRIRNSSANSERTEEEGYYSKFGDRPTSRDAREVPQHRERDGRHRDQDSRRHDEHRGRHQHDHSGRKSERSRSPVRHPRVSPSPSSTSNGQILDFTEFLDRAYSDRPRPESREKTTPSKRTRDGRDKRRFNDRSVDKDRWESNVDRGVQHIKKSFVSGGTHKF